MNSRNCLIVAAILGSAPFRASHAPKHLRPPQKPPNRLRLPPSRAPKDIVDTAVAAGNFKTLATALTAAGLIDTLKGPGPFTVFDPRMKPLRSFPKAP